MAIYGCGNPLSTLPNWISEFERFVPELPVVVHYGSDQKRLELRKNVSKKYTFRESSAHFVLCS